MRIGTGKPFIPQKFQVQSVQAERLWALHVDVHEIQNLGVERAMCVFRLPMCTSYCTYRAGEIMGTLNTEESIVN